MKERERRREEEIFQPLLIPEIATMARAGQSQI